LPVFFWQFLHLCSLKISVCNSFFCCIYIGFWNEYNACFIEWVW
jgi:hypothetical protein